MRLPAAQVTGLLHTAHELTRRLPATLALLERGDISTRHAEVLVTAVNHLPDHAAVAVQECVLPRAPRQTVPRFRDCVRRAVITVDPRDAEQRHTDAATGRGVWKHLDNDGMGELTARLTADGLMTVMDRLDAIASVRLPGDERSADQRRADALVALSTLLALDENPGELTGYGPIPATLARRIAADPSGTWRRLVTDPRGRLLDYGRTTYTPPQDLTDFVVAHDGVCRFPTSNVPARRCELDHDIAWDDGGTTCPENLTAKTSRHHHLKHEAGWTVTRDRVTGVVTWRTPTGHTYTDHPAEHPRDHTVDRVGSPADPPDDADSPPF